MLAGFRNIWNIYIYTPIEYLSIVSSFMLEALLMMLD